jgi:hypothetical protein
VAKKEWNFSEEEVSYCCVTRQKIRRVTYPNHARLGHYQQLELLESVKKLNPAFWGHCAIKTMVIPPMPSRTPEHVERGRQPYATLKVRYCIIVNILMEDIHGPQPGTIDQWPDLDEHSLC